MENLVGLLVQSSSNTIGGASAGAGNIFGANEAAGLQLAGPSGTNNLVLGNYFGTNASGARFTNIAELLVDSASNTIGGTSAGAGNVFGLSTAAALQFRGAAATNNVVLGNLFGTNASGANLGNAVGLSVGGASNTIGGTATGAGNVFAYNSTAGVEITGAGASDNALLGNLIGTDSTGQVGARERHRSADQWRRGQRDRRDVRRHGKCHFGQHNSRNRARQQFRHRDPDSGQPDRHEPGRHERRRACESARLAPGSSECRGCDHRVHRQPGWWHEPASGQPHFRQLRRRDARHNRWGRRRESSFRKPDRNGFIRDQRGWQHCGNLHQRRAAGNQIGGTVSGSANLVSGNSSVGVEIYGGGSTGNLVEGNIIGLASDGHSALRKPSGQFVQPTGVFILNASGNVIGGASSAARNVISGNQNAGVYIFSKAGVSSGNIVQQNLIGRAAGGSPGPGNNGYGVLLLDCAEQSSRPEGRGRQSVRAQPHRELPKLDRAAGRGPSRADPGPRRRNVQWFASKSDPSHRGHASSPAGETLAMKRERSPAAWPSAAADWTAGFPARRPLCLRINTHPAPAG